MSLRACIVGPKLYRIYSNIVHDADAERGAYMANPVERAGQQVMQGLNILWNIGMYTSPIIISYLWRRDYFCLAGCISLGKFATGLSLLLIVSLVVRGIGRYANPSYTTFLIRMEQTSQYHLQHPRLPALKLSSEYDCEMSGLPTTFSWQDVEGDAKKHRVQAGKGVSSWWSVKFPSHFLCWCFAHLFGRPLIYPGSIHLLQAALAPHLISGREKLVLEHGAKRSKLQARDGNYIDCMYVDRRNNDMFASHGNTLVVCCEGNAGFYELGIMTTPLAAGYSVLGWNHPGFAESTGQPFPQEEQNAVDVVMQFAIHRLGFKLENILVYAWSIGGYTGTWAAMNYPEIRGMVLDATFDDILPLALPRMPNWMGGLITATVRENFNLNIAEQACKFFGPLTIIRRTRDEIITTDEGVLSTNRGNNLVMDVLKCRYPNLQCKAATEMLTQYLAEETVKQEVLLRTAGVDEDYCQVVINSYMAEHEQVYPVMLGEDMSNEDKVRMLLFLASKLLVDFASNHNNPLDEVYFRQPWSPITEPSYVQLG